MAKHHWNWTKKAVLASLMLGASVLVTSTSQAVEKTLENYLTENFNKHAFTLTEEAARLQGQKLPKVIDKLIEVFTNLNTNDLMALAVTRFANNLTEEDGNEDLIKQIFGYDKDYLNNSEDLYNHIASDENLSKLIEERDSLLPQDLISLLLTKELLRRSENYETIIKGWRNSNSEAEKKTSDLQKSLEKESEKVLLLAKEWKNQKSTISVLNEQLKDSTDKQTKLQEVISQTEKDKQILKTKSDRLTTQLKSSQEANSDLQAKMKDLETQAKKAADEAKALHEQVNETANQNQNLQSQLESKQKDLTDLQQQLTSDRKLSEEEKAKLEKQLADIQSKIAEKDASIKSLEGQLDTLKRQEHDTTPSTPETPQVPEVKPEDKPAEPQQPETKPQAPQAPEAGKPSAPKKPEIKPAPTPAIPEVKPSAPRTPEKPGKGKPAAPKAHHATTPTTPHMAASSTQNTAAHLPQTGETTVNPFFSVAALSIIASAGVLATKRKED
ncbi:LPXTG cell wall anchor domain-containing protein [Streptococcus halichoeri]|uniref:LPXTG cell wall anchor domain-containing protein n=1 Tax=Streptococcus halichoeri TaxID=254785 RepID=UPI001357AB0F|nr:LPXTG cell wall anchor domain-containing protein [Streptococcus halichoeri]